MARLWSSGHELRSVTAGMEYETVTGAGVTTETTIVHGGGAALKTAPSATTAFIRHTFQADAINTLYFRHYLYIGTYPGATISVWRYLDSGNGVGYSLSMTNAGVLQMINDAANTTVLASSSALSTGQWYRLEIKIIDSSTTTATFELKIDGTTVSTQTNKTGLSGGGRVSYGAITGTSSPVLYWDDNAVNDSTGSFQNTYPGNGKIVHLYPDAAGDNAGFTPLSSTNISNVDETPTPDDATSYNSINSAATAGTQIDDFNVGSPVTAGIASSDTVNVVQVGIRGGSTATTSGATLNPRVKSAAAGTTTTASVADAYNVNGWRTNGATPFQYGLTSYTDPTTSAAWTVTGTNSLTNMQIGYTNAASNTTVRRVSSVWALIDYTPVGVTKVNITKSAKYSVKVKISTLTKSLTYRVKPLTQYLVDDFSDNSQNVLLWDAFNNFAETSSQLQATTGLTSVYSGYDSHYRWQLTGSYVFTSLADVGNQAIVSKEVYPIAVLDANNTTNSVFWYIQSLTNGGNIVAYKKIAGSSTSLRGDTLYDSNVHKYFRISEASGTTYWDYSTDGSSWTTYYSVANPITVTDVIVELIAGNYAAEILTTIVKWNGVNSLDTVTTPHTIQLSDKYAVKVKLSTTKALIYKVKGKVAPTKSLKYTVKATHAAITKTLRYFVTTEQTAIQKTLNYYVNKKRSTTKSLKYTVKTTHAAITKTLRYYVSTEQAPIQKSLNYQTLVKRDLTKNLKYTVEALAAPITKSVRYAVVIEHDITKSLKYVTKPVLSQTKSLKYTVTAEHAAIQKSLTYIVNASPIIHESLKYTVKGAALKVTKSLRYEVFKKLNITKSLRYAVAVKTDATKSLKYIVVATTAPMQKSLKYTITLKHDHILSSKYTIRTKHAISKFLTYLVKTEPTAPEKVLRYYVKRPRSLTRPLHYYVSRKLSTTKQLTYRVEIPATQSKSLTYFVATGESIVLGLTYRVKPERVIQLSSRYVVHFERTLQLSLTYRVGIPPPTYVVHLVLNGAQNEFVLDGRNNEFTLKASDNNVTINLGENQA